MSDLDSAKFDDELLSAYLDNELTPDERARVEAHLAMDPQARQLLDELRAVSRAMKEVPPATLGTDLRDSVLRRAERAMLLPGERPTAHGLNGVIRKLPFGRSKRAWAWAGAALAAGLLLMFIEKEPARNRGLPGAVAKRERVSQLEVRSAPASTAQEEQEKADEHAAALPASPAPSAGVVAEGYDGGGGSSVIARGEVAGAADSDDLLVVHVNVKPEALRSRAIDGVLARNQIEVEEPAAREMLKANLQDAPQETQDVDVLLIEAAPAQIMSTLAEMDADHTNYLGIAVDDQLAASQRARAAERLEYDFKQHDRGITSVEQKLKIAPNRNYYYETKQGPIEIDRSVRRQIELPQQLLRDDRSPEAIAGRALRVAPQAEGRKDGAYQILAKEQNREAEASSPLLASSTTSDSAGDANSGFARRASQKLAAKAEMLQVLFVLTAGEEQAPAKPASSPTVKEGLKIDE